MKSWQASCQFNLARKLKQLKLFSTDLKWQKRKKCIKDSQVFSLARFRLNFNKTDFKHTTFVHLNHHCRPNIQSVPKVRQCRLTWRLWNAWPMHVLGGMFLQRKRFRLFPRFFISVVCLSVVCLSHSWTPLKPFDGSRCHLAGTLVGSSDTLCQMGVPDSQGKGRFGSRTPIHNMQMKIAAATWRIQPRSWVDLPKGFRLLPNYFVAC